MKQAGEERETQRKKVLTSFSLRGVNPFWKCDIWRNRILSAGKLWSSLSHTHTPLEKGSCTLNVRLQPTAMCEDVLGCRNMRWCVCVCTYMHSVLIRLRMCVCVHPVCGM